MKFFLVVSLLISFTTVVNSQSNTSLLPGKASLSKGKSTEDGSLLFIENKGQVHTPDGKSLPSILYTVHDRNLNIFLKKNGLSYIFRKSEKQDAEVGLNKSISEKIKRTQSKNTLYRLDLELVNANQHPDIIAEKEQQYQEKFFTINSGKSGISNIRSYTRIVYKEIYPHIDWIIYITEKGVKYDFIIRPGGNLRDIKLKYNGADALKLNNDGSITAVTPLGKVTENAPYSYEIESGKEIPSSFKLEDNVLQFITEKHQGTLVIDPAIDWVTAYGGDDNDVSYGITSDKHGNTYMTGATSSLNNVATFGSYQSSYSGGFRDAFVFKLDSAGNKIWGTYFGGNNWDESMAITIDSLNNIYIGGFTMSSANIATPGSHQQVYGGFGDAFLAKFDSSGTRIWSTYFGGSGSTEGYAVCLDNNENVFLAGHTFSSTGVATPGAYQTANAGDLDGFVVKFNPSGQRQWSTYYGGNNTEQGNGIACDSLGNVYFIGTTRSVNNISTNNGHQTAYGGGLYDAFLVKFSSSGSRIWATYYGGLQPDYGNAVICDRGNNIIITGETESSNNISTPGAHQDSFSNGFSNAFITKFSNNGTRIWGTYYGGDGETIGTALATDNSGNLYCGGRTSSYTNIHTPDAFQTSYGGSWDMFISKFTNGGTREFGSYYGTGIDNLVRSICYSNSGALYMTGGDLFYNILTLKLRLENKLKLHGVTYSCENGNSIRVSFFSSGQTYADNSFAVEISDANGNFSNAVLLGATNFTSPFTVAIPNNISGQGYRIRLKSTSPELISDTFDLATIHPLPVPAITSNGSLLWTGSFSSYQWYRNNQIINGATDSTYQVTQSGDYTVMVSDTNGCTKMSDPFVFDISDIENASFANKIKVYPNPTFATINIASPKPVTIEIFSIEGKKIFSKEKTSRVDMSSYPDGLYIMRILGEDGHTIKMDKLIKHR